MARDLALGRQRRPRLAWSVWTYLGTVLFVLSGVVVAFPFLWMVRSSLMSQDEVMQFPPLWMPSHLTLLNYSDALTIQPFAHYIANSLIIAVCTSAGQVLTSAMSAYAFARLRFPGRDRLFLLYLATMMIPSQVTLIPQYVLISKFGWVDNYLALIVPGLASAFFTFLLRQFFISLPREIEESARIDGAGHVRTFLWITLPLSRPALASVTLLAFMGSWTSFLWPLVIIHSADLRTIPIGLAALQQQTGTIDVPEIMAGACMALLPMFILFIFLQRYFIESVLTSGIKG